MGRFAAAILTLLLVTSCATFRARPVTWNGTIQNPILSGHHPDPQILWKDGEYFLTYTAGSQILFKRSPDSKNWSAPQALFANTDGTAPLIVNGKGFCHVWAPEFFPTNLKGENKTILLFSALGFEDGKVPEKCPPFQGATALYYALGDSPNDPFATSTNEPAAFGWNSDCKTNDYPHARPSATCEGQSCENFPRLDGTFFRHGDRTYIAYSWFTNPDPKTAWEKQNHGVNLSVREVPSDEPTRSLCNAPALVTLSPGDRELEHQIAKSCPRCFERMSFSKDTGNLPLKWNGHPGGILEGASLFQRGDYVYLLFSHSEFESAFYSVAWIAAKSVAGLAKKERLIGRYLIPSQNFAFGHGSPLQIGDDWFYVYHRIDHDACLKQTGRKCERDVFVSPMEFEDRGDGKGAVYLKALFPAEANLVNEGT